MRDKVQEMLVYICRHRMYLTQQLSVEDLELSDSVPAPLLPEYRIDFSAEIIYTADKVTPVNLGSEADGRVNELKLFDAGNVTLSLVALFLPHLTIASSSF